MTIKIHHPAPVTDEWIRKFVDMALRVRDLEKEALRVLGTHLPMEYVVCNKPGKASLNPAGFTDDPADLDWVFNAAKRIHRVLNPSYLKPAQRYYRPKDATPSWGLCYVASEALYHLGAKEWGFRPAYVPDPNGPTHTPAVFHWFLVRDGKGGLDGDLQILDVTADQFTSAKAKRKLHASYAKAVRCGFLTKKPSKRAERMMVLA